LRSGRVNDVVFVARGAHLAGASLARFAHRQREGQSSCVDVQRDGCSMRPLSPVDVVMFCVKPGMSSRVPRQIAPLVAQRLVSPFHFQKRHRTAPISFVPRRRALRTLLGGVAYFLLAVDQRGRALIATRRHDGAPFAFGAFDGSLAPLR
jgi:hypothetical protein